MSEEQPVGKPSAVAGDLWRDLCEKDDRTSPEDYPDMALIKEDEFYYCLEAFAARRVEHAVAEERERCFTWAIGRVPRSAACRAIKEGDDPKASDRDPSRCWRCGEPLNPHHFCWVEEERPKP